MFCTNTEQVKSKTGNCMSTMIFFFFCFHLVNHYRFILFYIYIGHRKSKQILNTTPLPFPKDYVYDLFKWIFFSVVILYQFHFSIYASRNPIYLDIRFVYRNKKCPFFLPFSFIHIVQNSKSQFTYTYGRYTYKGCEVIQNNIIKFFFC